MPRILFILPLLFTGCVSIEQIAPPVQGAIIETGRAQGVSADVLERGRMIYLNQCAKCHTAEPVDRYSLLQWQKILPEMNEEAKLNRAQAAEVEAYIRAAHRTMSMNAETAK
jgi:mono/diheme cytochrome c family protein